MYCKQCLLDQLIVSFCLRSLFHRGDKGRNYNPWVVGDWNHGRQCQEDMMIITHVNNNRHRITTQIRFHKNSDNRDHDIDNE